MKSTFASIRPFRGHILCVLCALCGSILISAKEVESEGRAAADQVTAREQALADALREAVRVGVGVDVASTSKVSDFALDYDRILSAAFGHVKTYKIVSSELGYLLMCLHKSVKEHQHKNQDTDYKEEISNKKRGADDVHKLW